jgi:DNA-binding transcriptional regulator YiaG
MQINKIEFYRLQAEAGLSNGQAARLFNVTKRSIEKWRIESPSAPKAVIMCLESIVSNRPVSRD